MPRFFLHGITLAVILLPFFLAFENTSAEEYQGIGEDLQEWGILEDTHESFEGHKTLSRGAFLQWLINFSGVSTQQVPFDAFTPFIDISAEDEYFPAIVLSYQAGALDQFLEHKKLLPHRSLNAIEALEIFFTLEGISVLDYKNGIDESLWKDLPTDPKSKQLVLMGIQQGYIRGNGNGEITPFAPLTQNQLAWMIKVRYQEIHVQKINYETSFDRIGQVEKLIQHQYVGNEDITREHLQDSAITGIIESLDDPYSVYLLPEESKGFEAYFEEDTPQKEQEYAGLGVVVQEAIDGGIVITQVFDGSPAQVSDIRVGDIVIAVEGENVQALSVSDIAKQLKGPVHTHVQITIIRGKKTLEKTFVREKIFVDSLSSVSVEVKDNIVWVRVRSFKHFTANDFVQALEENITSRTKGVIVDLRYNPGGVLKTAQQMLGEVLSEGHIAVRLYSPKGEQILQVEGDGRFTDIPMVVFQNEYSASASEIFSSAIQDYDRGTIIGKQSFGKGVAQTLFHLKKGSLKLTTAEFRSPLQNKIHEIGVSPDIVIKNEDDNSYLYEAKRILR